MDDKRREKDIEAVDTDGFEEMRGSSSYWRGYYLSIMHYGWAPDNQTVGPHNNLKGEEFEERWIRIRFYLKVSEPPCSVYLLGFIIDVKMQFIF